MALNPTSETLRWNNLMRLTSKFEPTSLMICFSR